MNKIYKTIWSRTKGCMVVVSELAKNHSKANIVNQKIGGSKLLRWAVLATLCVGTVSVAGVLPIQATDQIVAKDIKTATPADRKKKEELIGEVLHPDRMALVRKALFQNRLTASAGTGEDHSFHYISIKENASGDGSNYSNDGAKWDQAIAIGPKALANDEGTLAIGYGANIPASTGHGDSGGRNGSYEYTTNKYAQAIGYNAQAAHSGAQAYGYKALAEGMNSLVIGREAKVSKLYKENEHQYYYDLQDSMAIGTGAQVTDGSQAIAIGTGAKVETGYGLALGAKSHVTGASGIAVGYNTQSTYTNALAVGNSAAAGGDSAAAYGTSANALGQHATAVGYSAKVGTKTKSGVAIGDGAEVDKLSTDSSDSTIDNGIAIGTNAKVYADGAQALGSGAQAFGGSAQAFGAGAKARGGESIAIGTYAVTGADKTTSSDEISPTKAIAVGYNTKAVMNSTVAIGDSAISQTNYAVAIGRNASVQADGSRSDDNGESGVAIGNGAKVTTAYGVAVGAGSQVDRKAITDDQLKKKALTGTERTQQVDIYKDVQQAVLNTFKGTYGAFSVGDSNDTRQIINVAAGTQDTDAVNLAQLKEVAHKSVFHFTSFRGTENDGNYSNDGAK